MALILKDRVKETSASSGTGSVTLGGAFAGYQTFNAAIATGSTVYYTIHNLSAGFDTEWEVGVGTFTSPATLSRDTVLSSSTGAKVNFTAGASGLEVFITQPAEQALYTNQATNKVEAFGNGANTITFTNINTTNLTATTVTLTNGTISTNAANATDITNKTYVDGLFSQSISYHEAVLVESPVTAGNLDAVYVQPNGASNGVGATLTNNAANVALVIDGVSVSNTARVLIYSQSNAVQNGVYTVTNPGAADPGGAKWVLTRATDADTYGLANPNTLGAGDAFFVQDGNTGAGETYVCNTQGTITFGSSNITFAQVSSAQIYAAGTGLNLANLTFSIANTTVVSGLYGDSATVPVIEVNAQGQLTSASNSAINVSSITVGTLPNARTTAASANGASTIVARDSNGDFTANTITATTSNATTFNGTTGAFTNVSGNGVALTAINASNVTSGTLDNARTTGNTSNIASTIVLRDASGAFDAGNITALNFIGAGTTITSINASNISSGTIDNARTTAASANGASTIVARGTSGEFSAGAITSTSISGNGASLTAINASAISSGTLAIAQGGTGASSLAGANIPVTNVANTFTGLQTFAGTSSNADLKTSNILETATVSATAAANTVAYDVTTQSVLYYTSNASGNFTVNFRGSSGTSLNTIMTTGESMSVTFLVTNGGTAYYNSVVQVDGSSVTPKWQGGSAPASGNANSIDSYTYVIIKTGNAAFTVLASQTKFA